MECLLLMVNNKSSPPSLYFSSVYPFLSITEPGFYEDGAFGIRIENVELVKKVDTKYQFNQVDYLSMEPVTLVIINVYNYSAIV